jgi:P4 family phage/plasmid primase-like protien
VRTWIGWGANIGLRAGFFPALDIDCADEQLAKIIEDAALTHLGPAPVRIGNPPKRLLPYRLGDGDPFGRMRLIIKDSAGQTYLVEILADGQQYLVAGTHPTTGRPYEWSEDPAEIGALKLTGITRDDANRFLDTLKEGLEQFGYECTRVGDGRAVAREVVEQRGLTAPSVEELRRVVELIPNSLDLFPGWDEYIRFLYAVKAAAGEHEEEGQEIFASWAQRWEGHGLRHADSWNPDEVRSLWRRTKGPFMIGFNWLAELARQYGYNDSPFDTVGEAPAPSPTAEEGDDRAPYLSDQWLALMVVEAASGVVRYVPAQGRWLTWEGGRWRPDMGLRAEDIVKVELRKIAAKIMREGATEKEKAANYAKALAICSGGKASAVRTLIQSDRAIAVEVDMLDHDKWKLNTPAGMVDLLTGEIVPPDPNALCTKTTSVAPSRIPTPVWDRFLDEATGGDKDLQLYLQRLAGYCLTGSTEEQIFAFFYGPGGNGKGVFLKTLLKVLKDYGYSAPMTTFVSSGQDRHPTELAAMCGARMVTASETQAGRRWDEARVKGLTGGDPVTAHFMRQDDFTYVPTFKLLFAGNHKPEVRDLDAAMRRRIHLVPFLVTPKVVDKKLEDKLEAELPGILQWMIDGCLEWQQQQLNPPQSVLAATQGYFEESDPLGQWLEECTEQDGEEWVDSQVLFESWKEWANAHEEYVGKQSRFTGMLVQRRYPRRKHPETRRSQFQGIKIVNRQDPIGAFIQ